jgi:hypothetical protein
VRSIIKLHWALLVSVTLVAAASAQTLEDLDRLSQQTLQALRAGQDASARERFREFNEKARAYVMAKGRGWRVQYLVGSLNCQFPESRGIGAEFLQDLLQNARELTPAAQDEVKRQLERCSNPQATRTSNTEIVNVSTAHFQSPGVRGDMKGGVANTYRPESQSGIAVVPKKPEELFARRVALSDPQRALRAALARLAGNASGAIVGSFAVTAKGGRAHAEEVGRCLNAYVAPLNRQFDFRPPNEMITVYTAESTNEVYRLARELHGISLPTGVIAYSVDEDMSLSAEGDLDACGSMAHELVHLLIKQNFPLAPPWLEEGLASEVAVATVAADTLTLNVSWRDDELKRFLGIRPRVSELLDKPWSAFTATGPFDRDESYAVQAMAAVFVRYLNQRGWLQDVYLESRDRHVASDLSTYRSYREVIEERAGQNIAAIDRDFAMWFEGSR